MLAASPPRFFAAILAAFSFKERNGVAQLDEALPLDTPLRLQRRSLRWLAQPHGDQLRFSRAIEFGRRGRDGRFLPSRASSKLSVTSRLRRFSIVCTRPSKASAIFASGHPGHRHRP